MRLHFSFFAQNLDIFCCLLSFVWWTAWGVFLFCRRILKWSCYHASDLNLHHCLQMILHQPARSILKPSKTLQACLYQHFQFSHIWSSEIGCNWEAAPSTGVQQRKAVGLCHHSTPSCVASEELSSVGNQLHRYLGIYTAGILFFFQWTICLVQFLCYLFAFSF